MSQKTKRIGFAVFGTFMAIPAATYLAVFMTTVRESTALGTFDLLAAAFAAMTAFGAWTMARWTAWSFAGWAVAVTCRQLAMKTLLDQDVNILVQATVVAIQVGITFLVYRKMAQYRALRSESPRQEATFY